MRSREIFYLLQVVAFYRCRVFFRGDLVYYIYAVTEIMSGTVLMCAGELLHRVNQENMGKAGSKGLLRGLSCQ